MTRTHRRPRPGVVPALRRSTAGALVAALGLLGIGLQAPSAVADTVPVSANVPETVSADPLPTWQVTGVVWSQVVVGTTVYATGAFTKARPPGMWQGGPTEISVGNLIAYDITTGQRIASFNHTLDAQGLAITASPDGSRVYVGGDFTTVDGQARGHLAAFDTATGALVPGFAPTVNGQVKALTATNDTVYAGGGFTGSGTSLRKYLASFTASTGALTSWAPSADDGYVWALTMTPDRSKVVAGGQFSTLNGLAVYGMGALDPTTGASLPWAANSTIKDYNRGAIDALTTDGTYIYGGGYAFGTGGAFEGSFSLNPGDGSVRWMVDCLGDTYDVEPVGNVVYTVSHSHNCTDVGAFPDTNPRTRWQHAGAYTSYPTGVNSGPSAYGWNYSGKPAPSMLQWYPDLGIGTASGQYQAAWNVTSGAGYVALGGEFPTVEGKPQQGLTRYALRAGATTPNKVGPRYDDTVPVRSGPPRTTAVATGPGTVRVGFGAAWDEDNQRLTYKVYRDRGTAAETLVKTLTVDSTFWTLPAQAVTDSSVPSGDHTYQVVVTDPFGNQLLSPVSPAVNTATVLPAYASQVLADGADHYWRLDDTGTTALDAVGEADGTAGTGVTRGVAGALANDPSTASSFNGASTASIGLGSGPLPAPKAFSVEGWFKTTSTTGGKVVSYGSSKSSASATYDRQVYLGPSGKVSFGVTSAKVVTSPTAYNDGQWHQFAASLGSDGATLWLDGRLVARDRSATTGGSYTGYWRIGGDAQATTWPNAPTTGFLTGSVDDVATYPTTLTQAQVVDHFVKSGRTSTAPASPSDSYGAAVFKAAPDLYWRLNEASGPVAADGAANDNRGLFVGSPTYAQTGALTTTTNRAVSLGAAGAGVASASSFAAASSYSEELWFKTTSTTGGKLIGFGSAASGLSTTVDRNLTMTDAGKLRFATLNGTTQVSLDTPLAYNDGAWHQVVATQAPQGMKIIVDGVVVASNSLNATSTMVGYWRVGYDKVWSGSTSSTFLGQIDEVAVYPRVVDLSEVKARYRLSGRTVANTAPVAAFTSAPAGLNVAFSGATSTDTDGTVAGYAWTFGDGTTGTGPDPSHTYAAGGTYTVTLTVTDDQGAKSTVSKAITLTNGLPTAAFQLTSTQRSISVDGSASKDPDGTLTGYAWDFGDGTGATGAKATHTYAADGTYTVTLTVTDNAGGTATTSQPVTVAATKPPVAAFTSSATGTLVAFDGSTSSDPDGTVAAYAWDFGDGTGSAEVRPTHAYAQPGTYQVRLTVTDDQTATGTTSSSLTVTNASPVAAFTSTTDALTATFAGGGSSDPDGTVTAYAWDFGDGTSDTGASPSHAYATPGTYTVRLTVTDDRGDTGTTTASVAVKAANVRPTASFTTASTDLAATFDASASSDTDGTVTAYAWDFGDGTTGTGVKPAHSYPAPGTYTVKLTVTDDAAGTGSVSKDVVITGPIGADAFGRTTSSGWGTADVGGAWTYSGSTSLFATSGGVGTITMASAGSGPAARLPLSSAGSDLRFDFAFDKAATGGGQFVRGIARGDQANGYGAKVWVSSSGTMYLYLTRVVGGTETDLTTAKALTGSFVPGTSYTLRVQVSGSGTTSLAAKAWPTAGTEPATAQVSATDTTSTLQGPGGVAVRAYLSGSATAASLPTVLRVDNVVVRPTGN